METIATTITLGVTPMMAVDVTMCAVDVSKKVASMIAM